MKNIVFIFLIFISFSTCYCQTNQIELTDKIQLTNKDLLDLKLQTLAAQMTCGSYRILDMGRINFPVSIEIDDKNEIIFTIEGNLDKNLSKETKYMTKIYNTQ